MTNEETVLIPNLRKTPPCPDQIWLAANIFSSFDVSTDTSLSDKTVFAHPALPWERTILRKSGMATQTGLEMVILFWNCYRDFKLTAKRCTIRLCSQRDNQAV